MIAGALTESFAVRFTLLFVLFTRPSHSPPNICDDREAPLFSGAGYRG
jgi:hypothetical protein